MSTITCPNTACGAVLEGRDLRHCPRCGSFLPIEAQTQGDPLLGRPILNGKYRILSIIGEGGMGKVYLAEQKLGTTTRKVAIKTLQPELAQDPQIIARFYRETETVIKLEHPNTIKFYDFGEIEEAGKKLFVVMEYLQGESLAHRLQRGPLTPQQAERIMAQVCGSLQEAHDNGIVHRDLKPENIYLLQKGQHGDFVKVLDFGIAKRDEADDKEAKLTRQGMVLGTPPYMSPEQFTGQKLDARSDVYALGVIAYEMVTGALPFTAATPWEWATKHLTSPPTPVEQQPHGVNVPDRHKAAIMRALQKDRAVRPQSVTEFAKDFTGQSSSDWATATGAYTGSGSGPVPQAVPATNVGMASVPHAGQAPHPAPTPNPFAPHPSQPGYPAPSSAGFAGTPPQQPGMNPGYAPPSQPGYPVQVPQKSNTGLLIVGVILLLGVLGGGGWFLASKVLGNKTPAQTPVATNTVDVFIPDARGLTAGNLYPDVAIAIAIPDVPVIAVAPLDAGTPTVVINPTVVDAGTSATTETPDSGPVVAAVEDAGSSSNGSHSGNTDTTPSGNTDTTPSGNTDNNPQPNNTPRPGAAQLASARALVRGNKLVEALAALESARAAGARPADVMPIRQTIRNRANNRLQDIMLGDSCGAAQQFFRSMRSAGIQLDRGMFGSGCPAP